MLHLGDDNEDDIRGRKEAFLSDTGVTTKLLKELGLELDDAWFRKPSFILQLKKPPKFPEGAWKGYTSDPPEGYVGPPSFAELRDRHRSRARTMLRTGAKIASFAVPCIAFGFMIPPLMPILALAAAGSALSVATYQAVQNVRARMELGEAVDRESAVLQVELNDAVDAWVLKQRKENPEWVNWYSMNVHSAQALSAYREQFETWKHGADRAFAHHIRELDNGVRIQLGAGNDVVMWRYQEGPRLSADANTGSNAQRDERRAALLWVAADLILRRRSDIAYELAQTEPDDKRVPELRQTFAELTNCAKEFLENAMQCASERQIATLDVESLGQQALRISDGNDFGEKEHELYVLAEKGLGITDGVRSNYPEL